MLAYVNDESLLVLAHDTPPYANALMLDRQTTRAVDPDTFCQS